MITLRRPSIVFFTLIMATIFLSWNYFNDSNSQSISSSSSSDKNELAADAELSAWIAENGGSESDQPPAAEDVLIQRIPKDNSHLLLMAFYSKENYSEKTVTIKNGSTIVLRDDGKGDDKKAGDGLYTAKITADVKEFRKLAINMWRQMKQSGYRPTRYIHRQIVFDPDASETFEADKFDVNEPVSIAGLTNALSLDITSNDFSAKVAKVPAPTLVDSIRQNSVFITNLAVIEDSTRTWNTCTQKGNINGPWTFGTLMRQLASKNTSQIATDSDVSAFVKNWLATWANTQVINGDTVNARTLVNTQILNPWLTKSKNAGSPTGQLDMKFAPFKLTAIVNRFDLRNGQKFGIPGSPCGEGRFVFCLIKSDCSNSQQMTIIFEYGINKPATCESEKNWAQQWVDLKNYSLGSILYNQALQNITDQFTLCGTDSLHYNQSSLDQLRTNEVALSPSPKTWELREFIIDSTGNLKETTVGQNPADKYNAKVVNADVKRMVSYVNNNKKLIKAGKDVTPVMWQGVPFLGAKAHIVGSPTGNPSNIYYWDGTDSTSKPTFIVDNDARANFSLETCAGCHAGESQTGFTHVDPAFFGTEAGLSGFLTGKAGSGGAIDFDNDSLNKKMTIRDAALRPSVTSPKTRVFNDINARASGLKSFVSTTCGSVLGISSQLLFQPTNMVH